MSRALVRARELCKFYHIGGRKVVALRNISFEVSYGELLAVVGASGAGKSTLLHLLGALDRPSSGQILFEGADIGDWADDKLAGFRNKTLGFVFQFHHLLPEFSAQENVMMPLLVGKMNLKEAAERAREILVEVGLEKRLHHRPGELSGGEQQRVAIARALVNSPKLMLADEPTGNLDSHTGNMVYNVLRRLNRQRNTTLVYVTHNDYLAAQADRVIHLADGSMAEK